MPRLSAHAVKSPIRLVRQSTTVPNTSNTSAFTAEISDMFAPFSNCHSGAMRSIEPGISRFRVRVFDAPRNDSLSSKHLAVLDESEIVGNLVVERTRLHVARLR